MDAAHANGEHIAALGVANLSEALGPVVENVLAVGEEVIVAHSGSVPLASIVAKEGFTVRCANGDSAAIGHSLGSCGKEKGVGALVHGWP